MIQEKTIKAINITTILSVSTMLLGAAVIALGISNFLNQRRITALEEIIFSIYEIEVEGTVEGEYR